MVLIDYQSVVNRYYSDWEAQNICSSEADRDWLKKCLDEAEQIDAEVVTRCWNCKNGTRGCDRYVRCSHPSGKVLLMKGSDFCSYGKPLDNTEAG